MLPDDPAASSVWQPPQPAEAQTASPAAASPSTAGSVSVVSPGFRRLGLGRLLRERAHDRLRSRRDRLAAAAGRESDRQGECERCKGYGDRAAHSR